MAKKLEVAVGQFSTAGSKPTNEDFYGIITPREPLLTSKGIAIAIADGVSASDAGDEASEMSIKGFLEDYYSTPESWTVKTSIQRVLTALNRWLHGQGQRVYGSSKGLVTTFSGLVLKSASAHLFHIGDTRIYRWRQNELEVMTNDHRAAVSGQREYLVRAMGIDTHLEIDYRVLPLEVGDIFVLTTDGVHDFIDNHVMAAEVGKPGQSLSMAAQALVERALANGSNDNLTCQILQITSLPVEGAGEFLRKLTENPFPPPLSPGMILDGYKVLRELHASSHIQVYLALDTDTNQQVVIKTPSANYEDDPVYIDMFVHEEWIGRRIESPHVMKVYDNNRPRQFLYYVTEYIEGQTLRQWMSDHPRPSLSDVRMIAEQIAQGLRAFHRLEMIHQDIKPENIMVDGHGTVKIIDFGSTKVGGIEEIDSPIERHSLVGTRDFTAPEYLQDKPGSNRSDIYSLGVIVYQMLTNGKLPFGKSITEGNLANLSYVPVKIVRDDVPDWFDHAIEKALKIEPSRRYGLLSEFIHDLTQPSDEFSRRNKSVPLVEKNPVEFWRGMSFILLVLLLVALGVNLI